MGDGCEAAACVAAERTCVRYEEEPGRDGGMEAEERESAGEAPLGTSGASPRAHQLPREALRSGLPPALLPHPWSHAAGGRSPDGERRNEAVDVPAGLSEPSSGAPHTDPERVGARVTKRESEGDVERLDIVGEKSPSTPMEEMELALLTAANDSDARGDGALEPRGVKFVDGSKSSSQEASDGIGDSHPASRTPRRRPDVGRESRDGDGTSSGMTKSAGRIQLFFLAGWREAERPRSACGRAESRVPTTAPKLAATCASDTR